MSNAILWMDPILDRKQSDVDRANELREKGWNNMTADEWADYLAGLKGSLNRSDYLRIENNIKLLSDVLELNLTTYVDAVPKFPTETYYTNLISNVEAIRAAYAIHGDTPATPSAPLTDYEKWNNVEKILADVYECLNANFHYYCGSEIYAGDNTGLLL